MIPETIRAVLFLGWIKLLNDAIRMMALLNISTDGDHMPHCVLAARGIADFILKALSASMKNHTQFW